MVRKINFEEEKESTRNSLYLYCIHILILSSFVFALGSMLTREHIWWEDKRNKPLPHIISKTVEKSSAISQCKCKSGEDENFQRVSAQHTNLIKPRLTNDYVKIELWISTKFTGALKYVLGFSWRPQGKFKTKQVLSSHLTH